MDMIDVTIVNVALPTIRRDLHASGTQLEWVVSGYMLAFAAALIVAGSFGDLFGRKRVFLTGVALFGAASLCAGLSVSPAELIACRIAAGTAAAAMAPQVLATFRVMFAAKERGQAFSIYGAMLGFASAVGLAAGGLLTDANLFGWSWRSVFFVNVPLAIATLAAGARLIPETKDDSARRPDLPGAVVLAAALVAIVYPLLEGRQLGWPAWSWALLALGVATLCALAVAEERRSRPQISPLIRARLLRIPPSPLAWACSLPSPPACSPSSWPSPSGCGPASTSHRCAPGSPPSRSAPAASCWPRSRSRSPSATAAGCWSWVVPSWPRARP
jgi:MFS family permease